MSSHFTVIVILFFTFIKSIFENINDVVYLLFLSNEGDTYIFYENCNDTIETSISFAVMKDKTILDQKLLLYLTSSRR